MKSSGQVKGIHSLEDIHGIAYDVKLQIEDWNGKTHFTITRLDDYGMVLGMESLKKAGAILISHTNTMMIMSKESSCVVPLIKSLQGKTTKLSSLRVIKGPEDMRPKGASRPLPPLEQVDREKELPEQLSRNMPEVSSLPQDMHGRHVCGRRQGKSRGDKPKRGMSTPPLGVPRMGKSTLL